MLLQHILFQDKIVFWGLEPRLALLVLSVQNCCNFTVAVPLLGFTERPNSIPSPGRQPPSRQLHGIRERNLPIASPWGHQAGHLTRPGTHTHTHHLTATARGEHTAQGAVLAKMIEWGNCSWLGGGGLAVRSAWCWVVWEIMASNCRLAIRKPFLMTGTAKHWSRLPKETVKAPSLEFFKSRLGKHLPGMTRME